MQVPSVDITLLKELRDKFLHKHTDLQSDYWRSRTHLEQYHATFAQRIGWKWQSVSKALASLGWAPGSDSSTARGSARILDYGCGTGIASQVWARHFEVQHIQLWDRSRLAMEFAKEQLTSEQTNGGSLTADILTEEPKNFEGTFVLLSHVVSELSREQVSILVEKLKTAEGFCWIEPGTPESSHELARARRELLMSLAALAPCPHQGPCGVLENPRGDSKAAWCHHFAKPPQEVFQSAFWKKFSDELGIDLRSLPVSYLVMEKPAAQKSNTGPGNEHISPAQDRAMIGRPRHFKGYSQFWVCREGRLEERKLIHRKNPTLHQTLNAPTFLQKWNGAELDGSTPLKETP